jgi:plastocyanin
MKTVLICLLVAILLLGCASQQQPSQQPPAQQPSGQPPGGNQTPPPNANEVTVQLIGFKFDPADIEVSAGTKVTWVNNDPARHTVTFDNGEFDTGDFPHGDSRSYVFNKAGNYTYHCTVHPSMKGSVTVR